ncbi:hypothetical protein QNH20_23135 [Neobacillus sp. WH10]|uniref:GAP1-N2 domain-containing protein n=1 Tax=Neobacillus sp. WH10 TaxID=3047873 RepID=UPI0024C10A09|nr:hypothetical protein [Neobacillus sp. WH10]WHY76949.1 hypothetical protein QNH20_23135 [Neobacillus sp. WH10]
MSGKIQQQMYTRERGGIFHATDGYDTIAISEGLDQAFVKKYLHPFCIYHSPKTLAERSEKDTALYPEAVTMFQPETGDLVIGQAVFVPADFTGTRSTYFMHNYIIPKALKEKWIKQPEKLFQINDFQTSYDMAHGKVLTEREIVGYEAREVLSVKSNLLGALGITEINFKQLLFAVMSSIAGKKKIFISLNAPLQDYSKYAMQLLELIFLYLPYSHRRKLGAMTFTSEPETKNYIHVMFFEPGTLNTRDRAIEKQFIFDFANNRISGVDLSDQQHEYLELALHHFTHSKRMDDFFEFAEMALAGLPESTKLELASYYQLTDIYLTVRYNDFSLYAKNKAGFLHSLMKFLQINSNEKPDLKGLFLTLLKEEKIAPDKAPALDYLNAVVSINAIVRSDEALFFILETLTYYQHDSHFHQLWKVIEQDMPTHEALVMFMNEHQDYGSLLELYLNERFKHLFPLEDILNELKTMVGTPYLFGIEKFKSNVRNRIATAISTDSDPFKAVQAVESYIVDLQNADFGEFKQDILSHTKLALLRSIRLQDLTLPDIKAFGKIFTKELNVRDLKDVKVKENYLITNTLYQLINIPSQDENFSLKPLTVAAREQLRGILQRILRDHPSPEQFQLLFIAFETEFDGVDYQGVLDYLIKHSDDKTLLSFVRGNARLVDIDFGYRRALRKYFISHPKSLWKNKTLRKELQLIKNYSLKQLLKEVETEAASPVVKFLKKNGLKLLMALVIVGGGAWWMLDSFFGTDSSVPKASKTAVSSKNNSEKEQKDKLTGTPISLDLFHKATMDVDGKSFSLHLDGKQVKNIIGKAQPDGSNSTLLTDNEGGQWPLNLTTDSDTQRLFDQNELLNDGVSLYGIEHDFTGDDIPEVVIVASNSISDSYVWVYSLKLKSNPLHPILEKKGRSTVQLDGNKLIFPDYEVYQYSTESQNFVKQNN